jgi:diguanylate cyclase (GGDEF)-like protein/PAS domain S-box-containing protein
MRHSLIILFISLMSTFCVAQNLSDTAFIDHTRDMITPSQQLVYYEDTQHTLSYESALAIPQDQWLHLPKKSANFGFSESAYWLSFNLKNHGRKKLELYVHLDYALLDKVNFYSIENGKLAEHFVTGDAFEFSMRPVESPTFLFPIQLKEIQTKRILLRIESKGTLQAPITVWQKEAFLIQNQSSLFLYGAFLSALLIMSAYNLCLFSIIRDKSYLLYSVFIFFMAGVHSSLDGFAYQWFWPKSPEWHQVSAITFIALGLLSTVLFTRSILPIPKKSYIQKGVVILTYIAVGSATLSIFLAYRQAAILNGVVTVIVMSGVVITCIAMLKHSPRIARFYCFAWGAYFTGIILKSSSNMGYIPHSTLSEYAGNIGGVIGIIVISLALADRVNAERKAKVNAQRQSIKNLSRFENLYQNALEGIFRFDKEGKLLSANPAFINLLGLEQSDIKKGIDWPAANYRLAKEKFSQLIEDINKDGQVINYETQISNQQGASIWVNISARLSHDEYTNKEIIEGTLINVNERKEFEEQLQHLAAHDSLTGFFNRRTFESEAKIKLQEVQDYKDTCCLMYLDLDQFKIVNDLCGHTAGDALLKKLSLRLLKEVNDLGNNQIIARLGGDEFGILLSHTKLEDAKHIAEQLRQSIESFLFVWEGNRHSIGVSIGLVELCPFHHSVEQVLVMADTACYMAKDQGRNRVHVFVESDKEMQFRQLEMQWVSTIKEALSQDQFFLVFQNITPNLNHSEHFHYEILLRLLNNNGNLCAPNQFLPAAERYNLMPNIDRWVIRHYFCWLKDNPDHLENLSCASINLSTQSIGDEAFSAFLVEVFDEFEIPASKICFEITEGMAITHIDNTHAFIDKFRSLGCRFALDDFGTGFSSYAYLKDLQIDYLKIDGIFIKNLVDDTVNTAMVKSISDVAQAIGIETIAEFVETEESRQKLIEIGITYSQGYHIHKPIKLESVAFAERTNNISS